MTITPNVTCSLMLLADLNVDQVLAFNTMEKLGGRAQVHVLAEELDMTPVATTAILRELQSLGRVRRIVHATLGAMWEVAA